MRAFGTPGELSQPSNVSLKDTTQPCRAVFVPRVHCELAVATFVLCEFCEQDRVGFSEFDDLCAGCHDVGA
ncbi:hypothetical protein MBOT_21690 [Mycobacterium botniense]|uniref:Uncharacterized protein n=1 Tax=Mycobacterium botniense TaxID=84962 RepID=A0A7I9XYC3_9MYCO|nr:hypothetical protein MBOT_21690 [Mycobacterium botniense]